MNHSEEQRHSSVEEQKLDQATGGAYTDRPVYCKCGATLPAGVSDIVCPVCGEVYNGTAVSVEETASRPHRHREDCNCGSYGSSSSSSRTK